MAPPWQAIAERPVLYTLLAAALVATEIRPIPISRGDETPDHITISTPFAVALLVLGPLSLALLVQVGAVLLDDLRMRRPWRKTCFNAAQYVISLVAAAVAYALGRREPLLGAHGHFGVGDIIPTLIAAVVLVVVNYLLVACVVSAEYGQPFRQVIAHDVVFATGTSAVLVSLAPVTAYVGHVEEWLLLLLLLPLLALHRNAAEAMEREMRALRDSLTGLGNRKFFELRGGRRLRERLSEGEPCAVLLVGFERFDEINDTLGHSVGDAALCEVARRLGEVVGTGALVARLGDQFVLLVPTDLPSAEQLALSLLDRLDTPAELGDVRLLLQTSVGVAVAPDHGRDAEELLRNAAVAMHDPSARHRRVSIYTPDAEAETRERLQLLSELRAAVDERQFMLVFQPQIAVTSGELVGVEALVRWRHPTRGLVYPDTFIGLAENSGLIAQVTAVVLDEALATVARLRAEGHRLRVAVNMSARQMSDITLPGLVAEALARHAVPPDVLTLEVTETGILSEPARVDAVVRALRDSGVSIAVDDYGTGQASLTYLKRLHVDELKIDKSFVIDMGSDSGDAIIVRSTIALGHDLGLRIVAEGVEDAATLALLRRLGSDIAQGWHIGRPMPEPDLRALLNRGRRIRLTAIGQD
ncbi:MAG: bifunctional diguanylate cyclase/phosphodiesterase [Actinomycetota bacterium]|nr:bifunctional diguanylate cyclase/phosphodiesterase [Actinomycetota bacterium]